MMRFPVLLPVAVLTLVQGQSFDPNKAGPQSWDPASVGTNTTVLTSPAEELLIHGGALTHHALM